MKVPKFRPKKDQGALQRFWDKIRNPLIRTSYLQHPPQGDRVMISKMTGKSLLTLWDQSGLASMINRRVCSSRMGVCAGQVFICLVTNQYDDKSHELLPFCQSCSDSNRGKEIDVAPFSTGICWGYNQPNTHRSGMLHESWCLLQSGGFLVTPDVLKQEDTPIIRTYAFLRQVISSESQSRIRASRRSVITRHPLARLAGYPRCPRGGLGDHFERSFSHWSLSD